MNSDSHEMRQTYAHQAGRLERRAYALSLNRLCAEREKATALLMQAAELWMRAASHCEGDTRVREYCEMRAGFCRHVGKRNLSMPEGSDRNDKRGTQDGD